MGNGLKPFTPSVRGMILPPMMGGVTILPIWISEAVRLCLLDYYHRSTSMVRLVPHPIDRWDLSALASPQPMTKAQTRLIDRLNASIEIRETPSITDHRIGRWDPVAFAHAMKSNMLIAETVPTQSWL
jgi:hypothetical protein